MSFTDEHKAILAKHRHLYDSLTTLGFIRNLDRPIFDELQKVHNEAISVVHYSHWCGECVADMIRIIYVNLDKEPAPASEPPKKQRNGK